MGEILERVKNRLISEEVVPDDAKLSEYIRTAEDRLCLRLGDEELPPRFESIAVEVVLKMHRREYFEGITSEKSDAISTAFVEDILDEYSAEIFAYLENAASGKVIRFL